jgi:GDP/UDP-N,N'-diacetylbacillosamine 2-epimerase (hydrolysing)
MRALKKIAVVTGSRAEFGLLSNTLRLIDSSRDMELLLVVTGMHLSPEFGFTVDEIVKDGFKIADRIEMILSSDSPVGIGKSIGLGIIGFMDCFRKLTPDILVVLGDRYEIFAAVTAAMVLNLPVAHISGGDVTEGAIDEQIRHAITKISHLHFVAIEQHAQRVRQMGEEAWRVHVVGEPCIDAIRNTKILTKKQLSKILSVSFNRTTAFVTYHPVTLQLTETAARVRSFLDALDKFDMDIIFTYPNADACGRLIIGEIEDFVRTHSNAVAFKSLGSKVYLNLLANVDIIIGNSSSGIVEAPSFKLPAVNIGNRQKGRLMPGNVICTVEETHAIFRGIKKALSPQFIKSLQRLKNPYDKGGTARKIVKVLSETKLGPALLNKKFIGWGKICAEILKK